MKRRRLLSVLMASALTVSAITVPVLAEESTETSYSKTLVVTLDPGHGGTENGAVSEISGEEVCEKDLNLQIAKYLRTYLKRYENVKVYMTRSTDKNVSLSSRAKTADKHQSDLFFSIHNNAEGDAQDYTDGASALVSGGQYHQELAQETWALGESVLEKIQEQTGITNRGLLKRYSGNSRRTYPNGKRADYYAIIRSGTEYGIPTILVEHSFVDNENDAEKLNTKEKIKSLAKADADAIAAYYGLSSKDGTVIGQRSGHFVRFLSRYLMQKDGDLYYVKSNEKYYTGWKTISRKYYYFSKNGKALRSVTKKISGKKYTFDENGICTNR